MSYPMRATNRHAGVQSYRESEILTATRGRLLVLTFDALVAALTRAKVGQMARDAGISAPAFDKARAITGELLATLDHSQGGSIAATLASIYAFLLGELSDLELTPDLPRLQRHIAMIAELRDAFATAADQTSAAP